MSSSIQHLRVHSDYLKLIGESPCVVKFTATWCGPCRTIGPLYSKLANEYDSKVKFLEIDIDTADEITNYEDVKSIPLFLFYHNGVKLNDLSLKGANQQLLSDNLQSFIRLMETPVSKIEGVVVVPSQSEKAFDMSKLVLDNVESSDDIEEPEYIPEYNGDENGEDCDMMGDICPEPTVVDNSGAVLEWSGPAGNIGP